MKKVTTAVVCPVFNETQTWQQICVSLTAIFDLVVVVDDGSDIPITTCALPGVTVLRHHRNLGKGSALETGFRHCLAQGAHVVGTIDSDGEHDPRCLQNPIDQLGNSGLVTFSRRPIFSDYSLARRIRNIWISKRLSNELGLELKDTQSGLRLFSAAALKAALKNDVAPGYAVETQMLRSVAASGFDVRETDIAYPGQQRPEKRLYNAHAALSDLYVLTSTLLGRRPKKSELPPKAAYKKPDIQKIGVGP
jgi:glycosyltransferase involved in cell wall biosynthesis